MNRSAELKRNGGNMDPEYGLVGGAQCESLEVRVPSVMETLKRKRQQTEEKLSDINAAIEALQAHPEVEQILTLLGKVHIR